MQITGLLHQSKFKPKGSDREISRIEVRARTGPPVLVPVKKEDWATWTASTEEQPAEQIAQPA